MLVTVFRWRLKPDTFERFSRGWEGVTRYYLERGSLGSALFRDNDGLVWAIARWPDEGTRDAAFIVPVSESLRAEMADCVAERLEPVELESVTDLWI